MEGSKLKVLIADDEPDIREILQFSLSAEGYEVFTAKDGNEALDKAKQHKPDLIVLDIMMPYKNGVEVCELLRAQATFKDTLIVMFTAVSDESTHIKGFETGADDYINKPVSPKVFVSRVNALFRRYSKAPSNKISIGNLVIDSDKYLVFVDGKETILAKKEFELLLLMAKRPGRVFLRAEILGQVWGQDVIVGDRTIDVHIRKIRQKLGIDCISTVKGVGYKFEWQPLSS
jgi:two-component system alkaline phosphatase synthesis response regulator PhoP